MPGGDRAGAPLGPGTVDLHEPGICHLVLDSTAIPLDDCVELISVAAAARNPRTATP